MHSLLLEPLTGEPETLTAQDLHRPAAEPGLEGVMQAAA